jgi:ribonuclease Z
MEEKAKPGRFNIERARELGVPEGPLFGRLQSGEDVVLEDGTVVHSADIMGPPRPGRIVAYCTDTRPCAAGVALSCNADLVIHEATYNEDLRIEAREFGHSTAAQAASVARDGNARMLLLTHFSTRFPDPNVLLEEARTIFPNVTLAQELVEVPV